MGWRVGWARCPRRIARRRWKLVQLLAYVKQDAEDESDARVANELWKFGAYVTLCLAASLRGNEGFMVDLAGMLMHIAKGRDGVIPNRRIDKRTIFSERECYNLPHVAICIYGKYKGETAFDHHIINVANETQSGLKPRWWSEKLLAVCRSEGRNSGPAFTDAHGRLASSLEYNAVFRAYMKQVQDKTRLIDKDESVGESYGISRTMRKTA
ncbi:hypothetical protein ACHAWF_000870, partial [Thalassiosira exigua]